MLLSHALRSVPNGSIVEFLASNTSTSATINYPSGIQAGDLIILSDRADSNSSANPTNVVPSGFTQIITQTVNTGTFGNNSRLTTSYKKADGSESGSITGMWSTRNYKIILVFRPSQNLNLTVGSVVYDDRHNSVLGPFTILASGAASPCVVFGHVSNNTSTPQSSTFSPTEDGSVTLAGNLNRYKIYNFSPQDVTIQTTAAADRAMLVGFYVTFT